MVTRSRAWGAEMGSNHLVGTEFQFCKMKSSGVNGGDVAQQGKCSSGTELYFKNG